MNSSFVGGYLAGTLFWDIWFGKCYSRPWLALQMPYTHTGLSSLHQGIFQPGYKGSISLPILTRDRGFIQDLALPCRLRRAWRRDNIHAGLLHKWSLPEVERWKWGGKGKKGQWNGRLCLTERSIKRHGLELMEKELEKLGYSLKLAKAIVEELKIEI